MTMGGRAAEMIVFKEYSAGASGDIEQATRIARHMMAHWGMSEKVGPVSFKQSDEHPFLGKEMHSYREFSEETARIIDIEVQEILMEANQTAIDMLTTHREKLDELAEALLEHEELERKDVRRILGPRAGEKDEEEPSDAADAVADKAAASTEDDASLESDTIAESDTQTDLTSDEDDT